MFIFGSFSCYIMIEFLAEVFMITSFGKFLRNLRMDEGELLLDMAAKLEVSPAFLSGVENGKRKIPEGWLSKITSLYGLSEEKFLQMKDCFYDSNNEIEIGLDDLRKNQRNLAIAFARKLESISDDDIERIQKVLNKGKK